MAVFAHSDGGAGEAPLDKRAQAIERCLGVIPMGRRIRWPYSTPAPNTSRIVWVQVSGSRRLTLASGMSAGKRLAVRTNWPVGRA